MLTRVKNLGYYTKTKRGESRFATLVGIVHVGPLQNEKVNNLAFICVRNNLIAHSFTQHGSFSWEKEQFSSEETFQFDTSFFDFKRDQNHAHP